MKKKFGISHSTLYVVSTPIGNLGDITYRALDVLKKVDFIAAEDTRHTMLLLNHFDIKANLVVLHNYNEQKKNHIILNQLKKKKNIALVSSAGTPLINDPGYHLVRSCRESGIRVVPLPGACAAITALCGAGISSKNFCFEGFLPEKNTNRKDTLSKLEEESRTIIFYESTHRILDCLHDIMKIWGPPNRYIVIARELTKIWESIYGAPVSAMISWIQKNPIRSIGEMVLIVEGKKKFWSVPDSRSLPIFCEDEESPGSIEQGAR